VVLGRAAARLEPLVNPTFRPGWKARGVHNPRPDEGKCASIQAGLNALAAPPGGIAVVSVDQPVDHRLLNALIDAAEDEWERPDAAGRRTIVIPVFHDRRGHPPLFSQSLIGELMGVCEETEGLKAIVRRDPARVLHVPWNDAGILINLNRPVDVTVARFRSVPPARPF
jgi:molybdenum cofactor cytidylyltransferase